MYIKELQVDNFKSFANDMTIPFLKGFTTISGPNGSGKSNIIDSILFALGLASVRNLRMEQLSDFISTHTKKNEAYVKVVFEPENDEEEQLSVARKIRKSPSGFNSVYYLNDQVSTLTEIHTKLEKYRITPNSYNVVMQNDVMSITNCSTVERRKIVDEIAGIADFNRRIDKAQEELLTIEERVEKSRNAHIAGYNCVQAVLIGYEDLLTIEFSELLKVSMGIGRGIAGCGEMCGTALGGAMLVSYVNGISEADKPHKLATEKKVKEFLAEFKETYGALRCDDLLKDWKTNPESKKKPCREMIMEVVRMLEKYLIQ